MQQLEESRVFKTALVVEDIESSNHWMSNRLRDTFPSIQVDQAFNLRQACHFFKHTPVYDIALIDLGLPDGGGNCQTRRMLRGRPRARRRRRAMATRNPIG